MYDLSRASVFVLGRSVRSDPASARRRSLQGRGEPPSPPPATCHPRRHRQRLGPRTALRHAIDERAGAHAGQRGADQRTLLAAQPRPQAAAFRRGTVDGLRANSRGCPASTRNFCSGFRCSTSIEPVDQPLRLPRSRLGARGGTIDARRRRFPGTRLRRRSIFGAQGLRLSEVRLTISARRRDRARGRRRRRWRSTASSRCRSMRRRKMSTT